LVRRLGVAPFVLPRPQDNGYPGGSAPESMALSSAGVLGASQAA
jgi:hypothetical protein